MRLKQEEIFIIIATFKGFFEKEGIDFQGAELYLFGSRTKPGLKGGDIDLLLKLPSSSVSLMKKLSAKCLVALHKQLGEQKIDLLIVDKRAHKQDPFTQMALDSAILLSKW